MILFDPIFQGLAISLMAGEVASLLLSRVTVPVLYFMSHQRGTRPLRPWCHHQQEHCHESGREVSRVLVGVDLDASASALKMAGVLASTWDARSPSSMRRHRSARLFHRGSDRDARSRTRAESPARPPGPRFAEEQVQRAVHVVVEEGPPGDALHEWPPTSI